MMGSPMATLVLISVQISTSTTWAQGNRQHHLHVGYHLHELRYERGACFAFASTSSRSDGRLSIDGHRLQLIHVLDHLDAGAV